VLTLIWLIRIISLILSPLLYLLARLWVRLFHRPFDLDLSFASVLQAPAAAEANGPSSTWNALPGEWRWVGLALFIAAIGGVFAIVWRRLSAAQNGEIEETRETVFSGELLLAQMLGAWPGWLQRLRSAAPALLSPFLSLSGESDTRRVIRQAYQSLLAAAGDRGLARRQNHTPLEYRDRLTHALPGEENHLAVMTGHYLQARYDKEPPPKEAADATRQAWQAVERALPERTDNG
jgi:hypothetical protein